MAKKTLDSWTNAELSEDTLLGVSGGAGEKLTAADKAPALSTKKTGSSPKTSASAGAESIAKTQTAPKFSDVVNAINQAKMPERTVVGGGTALDRFQRAMSKG